jgi:class 3 adenylate cyclase
MSSLPLQVDPRLVEVVELLRGTGAGAELYDHEWRLVWISDELKAAIGETDEEVLGYGKHMMEAVCMNPLWVSRLDPSTYFDIALEWTPLMIDATPGGKETLFQLASRALRTWDPPVEFEDTDLRAWFDAIEPVRVPPVYRSRFRFTDPEKLPEEVECFLVRLHDEAGEHIGFALVHTIGLPSSLIVPLTRGDRGMFERMARLASPGRRQAAIVFADLQASAELSRRLPSAAYFRLVGELTRRIDAAVAAHQGVVGKHAGDGVTAFFLVEELGSPSAAARVAIDAARQLREIAKDLSKEMSDEVGVLEGEEFSLNIGVHWGATLYMGQLVTDGRLEVTALGDEVNECARIQQSAREGDALASKTLIEHLSPEDAEALGLQLDRVRYLPVAELPGATEKARRDAGGISVTVL